VARKNAFMNDWWATPTARVHGAALLALAVGLPGGSLLVGDGVFAWTMFSKSETYRITIEVEAPGGGRRQVDPRALAPLVGPSLAYFLPRPGEWRHDPVGLTFRTGLGHIARLACRLGAPGGAEVTLEERADLDASPRVTVARAACP